MSSRELRVQELERKMYELDQEYTALRIQVLKLKSEIAAGLPKSGDVVSWDGNLYLCTDEPTDPTIDDGPVIVNLKTGVRYSPSPIKYEIRGNINDVFITKQRVAEILTESRDSTEDNVFDCKEWYSLGVTGTDALVKAFAAEGIKEVK